MTVGIGGSSPSPGPTPTNPASEYVSALFIEADCTEAEVVGTTVRAGANATSVKKVTAADPFPAIGIVVSKKSTLRCLVQTYGLCTTLSGLTANSRYFVGTDGTPALIAALSSSGQFVQAIGFATGSSTFFIQPTATVYTRSFASNAAGQDATPSPSGSTQSTFYAGVLFGQEPPAPDLGSKGDAYHQYVGETDIVAFGPKTDEGWGSGRSLRGPAGKDGNRNYVRQAPPDQSIEPNEGDCWFDTSNGDVVFYGAA